MCVDPACLRAILDVLRDAGVTRATVPVAIDGTYAHPPTLDVTFAEPPEPTTPFVGKDGKPVDLDAGAGDLARDPDADLEGANFPKPGRGAEQDRQTLAFWAPDLSDKERAERAVKAQRIVCDLPSETYRRDRDIYNIRMYENNPVITLFSFAGKYYQETSAVSLAPPEQSVNNKAKAMIDTFASQVFSTDQRARFRTVDGNYRQRRRAREMQNFADGLAHELELHEMRKRAGMDACILESGAGALQFYREDGRVKVQRALATEFAIDPLDGLVDGQPQTLYRRRPLPRDKVRALFGAKDGYDPDKTDNDPIDVAIANVGSIQTGGAPADHIEVFEQWHLPTTKDADDGWHVISLEYDGGTPLLVEPYTKLFHEVVFFSVEPRFCTTWGLSLMTQARPLQCRINLNSYRVDKLQKLFHAGMLYVNRAAKIKKSMLSNEIGAVLEGNGDTPPQRIAFEMASAELYQQIERDGQRIFENTGINIGASQGQSQLGANAPAAAMREESAKSDQRNSPRQQRWEKFHTDCMRVGLSVVRDIVTHNDDGQKRKTKVGYKVAAPGKRGLTVTDWKDVAMDEADYVLDVKPASPVPTDPDALVAYGERMVELKAWTPERLAGEMQDLDADSRTNRMLAQERLLEKVFDKLLYDKAYAAVPDEFTNVQLALELGPEYLAQGEEDGVPEKHLERVRRYLKRCKALVPPPPAPAPPPGAPAAPPPPMAA